MKQQLKRPIALLLALSMWFGLLSTGAWASDLSGDGVGDVYIVNDEGDGSTSEPDEAPEADPDESAPPETPKEAENAPKEEEAPAPKALRGAKKSAPKTEELKVQDTTSPYNVYVGGTPVTSENMNDVFEGGATNDGKVSYDPDTKTLTLNGATISGGYSNVALYAYDDLTR